MTHKLIASFTCSALPVELQRLHLPGFDHLHDPFICFVAFNKGGVSFTEDLISWRLPRHITPLLSSSSCETLEAYMGIDGQRMDEATMIAQGYYFYVTDTHFVVEMPIGSPYGYYKVGNRRARTHVVTKGKPSVWIITV